MTRLRLVFAALAIVLFAVVLAQPVRATIATQQAQIGVTIVINVTPSPLAYVPARRAADVRPVITSVVLKREPFSASAYRAESLHFERSSAIVIAQSQVQHSMLVQSQVSPNPKATILEAQPTSIVQIGAMAGSTTEVTCAFQVWVNMSTAWSLEEGISNDFSSGFPGKNLANNTYISAATPRPTSTPYVVYADDGKTWSLLGSGNTITKFCVDLTITVPAATPQGAYPTNAIYTLFN